MNPATDEHFEVDCPHCGKHFDAALLGDTERNLGFKCPHCRLFVAFKAADDQDLVEPTDD